MNVSDLEEQVQESKSDTNICYHWNAVEGPRENTDPLVTEFSFLLHERFILFVHNHCRQFHSVVLNTEVFSKVLLSSQCLLYVIFCLSITLLNFELITKWNMRVIKKWVELIFVEQSDLIQGHSGLAVFLVEGASS